VTRRAEHRQPQPDAGSASMGTGAAGASTRPLEVRREAARWLPRRDLAFLESSSFSFLCVSSFEATVADLLLLPLKGCVELRLVELVQTGL